MPVSNVNAYGIGKGAAQIIDTTSGAQQGFANALAKQQAQRQLEQKQLADQAAQLKPDGLRNDADRTDFFKGVNDWRTQAIAAQNERDPMKKAQLKAQADQAYLQTQALVSKSKQQAAKENAFNTFAMNDATRHQLTDDAVTKGLANTQLGVNDPNIISDYSTLQRAPDVNAFNKRLADINTARLNNTKEDYSLGKLTNIGNTQQTPVTKFKKGDANAQALDYLNEATINPAFANVLEHKYPQLYQGAQTADQYHQAHALASTQLAQDTPLYKDMGTTFTKQDETDADKAALHAKNRLFDVNHPINPSIIGSNPTPQTVPIVFKAGTNPNKTSVTTTLKNYVPVNIPKATMIPTIGVNDAGENEDLPAGEVRVIGYGEKPVLKVDVNGAKKGTIAQSDFVKNHPDMVDYEKVAHVQQDHKGNTRNYFVPVDAIGVNNTGMKNQAKAVQGAKGSLPKNSAAKYGL